VVDPEKLKHLDERRRRILAADRLARQFLHAEDNTPLKKAIIIALFAHIVLIGMVFPSFERKVDTEERKVVYMLRPYTPPAKKKERTIQKLEKVKRVPLPDPTPEEPEPIREPEPDEDLPPLPEDVEILFGIPEGPPAPLAQRVGVAGITEPKRTHYVDPEYPVLARSAQLQGEVILDIIIDEKGNVPSSGIQVLKGLPMGLTEAAQNAVKQWKYEPSTQYGRPVPVVMTIRVQFRLE
jgi:TonB family protein